MIKRKFMFALHLKNLKGSKKVLAGVQAVQEQSRLQRQLTESQSQLWNLYEALPAIEERQGRSLELMKQSQQQHTLYCHNTKILAAEEQLLRKEIEMLEDELRYLKESTQGFAFQLDMRKAKYLVIDHEVVIDGDLYPPPDDPLGKRCKFYPADGSQLKFRFQECEDGFLVNKISSEMGFTLLPHRIAFPSQGIYHLFFQLRAIYFNDFLIGICTTSQPLRSLYFNFHNRQIQTNGHHIDTLECELKQDSVIALVIDANRQRMICCVDQHFHSVVDWGNIGLDGEQVRMFLGMESSETVIFFSNS